MFDLIFCICLILLVCFNSCLADEHDANDAMPHGLKDHEIETLVDTILEDEDHNKDGYVSYSEFMMSQQGEAVQTNP